MSTEENKRLTVRWLEEVFNQGNLATIDELAAANLVFHMPSPAPDLMGADAFTQLVRDFRAGVPDLRHTLHDLIAEGDKVAVRATLSGTHRGDFLGIPPTGQPVSVSAISVYRFAEGKLVEAWNEWDAGGMEQRLRASGAG